MFYHHLVPQFLYHGIVGVLMRDIEGAVDGATIWVLVVSREDLVLVK